MSTTPPEPPQQRTPTGYTGLGRSPDLRRDPAGARERRDRDLVHRRDRARDRRRGERRLRRARLGRRDHVADGCVHPLPRHREGEPRPRAVDKRRAVERATGIGGVFVRSPHPDALRAWYARAPRPGPARSSAARCMAVERRRDARLGRVRGRHRVLRVARAAGDGQLPRRATSTRCSRSYALQASRWRTTSRSMEFGRFGWATDPDGNRFELWEPAAGQ